MKSRYFTKLDLPLPNGYSLYKEYEFESYTWRRGMERIGINGLYETCEAAASAAYASMNEDE